MTLLNGKPPAIDFANVMRSGFTPNCSIAKSVPVRPKPDCTSSATITISCCVQNFLNLAMASLEAGINPPSPATGSITVQAIVLGSNSKLFKSKSTFSDGNSNLWIFGTNGPNPFL